MTSVFEASTVNEHQTYMGDWIQLAHTFGHRNRAGAPLSPAPSYDVHLALRLLTAAHEVMQRVATDTAKPNMVGELAGFVRAMSGGSAKPPTMTGARTVARSKSRAS